MDIPSIAYFSSGMSLYDYFFLNRLREKFSVVLLTFSPKPKHLPKDINIVTLPNFVRRLPAHDAPRIYSTVPLKVAMLKRFLKDIRPDILIGCGGLDYGFVSALSGYKPFVLFIWGSEVLVFPRILPFRAIVKYSLKKANLVVLDSFVQLKACIKLGCDRRKIIRLPWVDSVELERLAKNVNVKKDKFRKKVGWGEDDPVIICTRSHEKVYSIETIIQAIPIILDDINNARFLFVGKGTLTKKLREMVRKLNVEENVYFTGFVSHDKIFYYLKNSDIYVSSSLSDGTSASLLEAMICELPCVVSDIPGNREWIKNGENGICLLYTSPSPRDLSTSRMPSSA